MTSRDRRLNRIGTPQPAKLLRPLQLCQPALDEQSIPLPAILIEKQNRLSRRTHSRLGSRRLNLHQPNQSVHLRFLRNQSHQNSAEPQRLLTQSGPQPIIPGSG